MNLDTYHTQLDFIAYKGKKKLPVVVDIPNLKAAPLIETHAHLDMLENPSLALARAAVVGITHIITLTNLSRGEQTFEVLDCWLEGAQLMLDAHFDMTDTHHDGHTQHPKQPEKTAPSLPQVLVAAGVHPHDASHYTPDVEKHLKHLAKKGQIVAIGEAGLDYYYDHSPRPVQREIFQRNLEIAHELNLPIIVHLRDAHDDGLAILKAIGTPPAGTILHCYNRDLEVAQPFLELGASLGFGGPVTFKNAAEVKETAVAVPLEKIVIETDCPFMAPTPFRGQKCEPAHSLWVADQIAELKGIELSELALATSHNAAKIFNIEMG